MFWHPMKLLAQWQPRTAATGEDPVSGEGLTPVVASVLAKACSSIESSSLVATVAGGGNRGRGSGFATANASPLSPDGTASASADTSSDVSPSGEGVGSGGLLG